MPDVEVRGHFIHYEAVGDPLRSPLVLLHGLGASGDSWREHAGRCAEQFFVIVPDLPGQGASAPTSREAYSVAEQAETLAGLLDRLELSRVHLAGHALGGTVALAFVLSHPDRVAGLILESTSPEALPDDVRERTRRALLASASQHGARRTAARELSTPEIHDQTQSIEQPAWALVYFDGLVDRLETIVAPTLVMVGDSDGAFVQRGAELLHGWIPFSRLVRVPDAGHVPHDENPEVFAADVLGFLREMDTAR